jgi:orotidine-5'-phosphate decarboxylase
MPTFADRLCAAQREKRSAVCVGIDPRPGLLPKEFRPRSDTPRDLAEAVTAWARELVAVVAPYAPIVKPQLAFFEAMGSAGYRAYHETVLAAQERGLLVLADAKRGDIGSTAAAYAEAHFDVIGADAMTVNPYLGRDSIEPFLPYCRRGKGIYVLVKTSNPGSADLQDLRVGEAPLHEHVARIVDAMGGEEGVVGTCGLSAVGAVAGATHPAELRRLRALLPRTPLLVPGFGAQGASAQDCASGFLADGTGAIVNSSRAITFAFREGAHAEKYGDARWRDSVREAVVEMRDALEAARGGARAGAGRAAE